MSYHLLTGDALAEQFEHYERSGKIVVIRECLMEGPTQSDSLSAFWRMRAGYIAETYVENEADYYKKVVAEFEKLAHLPPGSEVNLWFEFDLFCQVNLWFSLWLLRESNITLNIYRVFPVHENPAQLWHGFGGMDGTALQQCFQQRVPLSEEDIFLGAQLWQAYSHNKMNKLRRLATKNPSSFPYLSEVCDAHIERLNGRLEKTLRSILAEGVTEFKEIFQRFSQREGIYGLGDLQVKKLYEQVR